MISCLGINGRSRETCKSHPIIKFIQQKVILLRVLVRCFEFQALALYIASSYFSIQNIIFSNNVQQATSTRTHIHFPTFPFFPFLTTCFNKPVKRVGECFRVFKYKLSEKYSFPCSISCFSRSQRSMNRAYEW